MIKKLRRKFIWIIMLIVAFMIFVIMGLTLDMTRTSLEEESLSVLRSAGFQDKKEPKPNGEGKEPKPMTTLTGQGGTVEGAETSGQTDNGEGETLAPPLSQRPANGPTGKENRGDKDQKNTRTPTFTLRYSDTGELIAEGSDVYDLTDTAYLEELLAHAKEKGTEYGILWYPELRFLRMDPQGSTYGFVDISSEFSTLQNLVLDSLLIGAGVFVAFLVLSIFLSRWAVKPVERAWNQQQQFVADASHEL
ncbi:MAG: hypothetical protein IKM59_00415, partial [Oscillospiraceae bacterium]|nr:hypothetical protein [Oscillospiraceae bacterium]